MKSLVFTAMLFFIFTSMAVAREPRPVPPPPLPHGVRPVDALHCPRTHPIKGNVNPKKGSRMYHLPGGALYDRVKPEVCFSTEKEAMAAGFVRSRR
ncbi:MAG: hypothetical protein HZB84_06945 [Deltaproteobacteria bacterium]|nr:hypothetical protein [Deltaproteobacteria bacterium]